MTKKTMMILLFAVLGSALLTLWFFNHRGSAPSEEEEDFEASTQEAKPSEKSKTTNLGSPESRPTESAPYQSFNPAVPPAYAKFFVRRGLQKKAETMLGIFPSTDTGKSLSLTATLLPYGTMEADHPAVAALAKQLGILKTHPEDTLKDLRQGLQTLPQDYARERQFLVQFASRLNVSPDEKSQFLSEEIRRPATPGPNGAPDVSFFNGAIALDSLIDTVHDAKQIEPILIQALTAQTTNEGRLILLSRYERLDPEGAQRLRSQYVH